MEDANSMRGLSSYFHHPNNPIPNPNTGGIFSNLSHSSEARSSGSPSPLLFPRAVAGRASAAPEPVPKRKRGRPRKYGTGVTSPTSSSASLPSSSHSHSSQSKKPVPIGTAGKGFTSHTIQVAAGEDVAQKIMPFVQLQKRAVCILSASGSISTASIWRPTTPESKTTCEGPFEILSLSGSFVHMETGGESRKTGGLTVCLSRADGSMLGGRVGGCLIAASPVQVIISSFLIDTDNSASASLDMDNSASKMPAAVPDETTLISPASLRSHEESSARIASNEGHGDQQRFGGSINNFVFHSQEMPIMPSKLPMDWRGMGGSGHGKQYLSPDDEDDEEVDRY